MQIKIKVQWKFLFNSTLFLVKFWKVIITKWYLSTLKLHRFCYLSVQREAEIICRIKIWYSSSPILLINIQRIRISVQKGMLIINHLKVILCTADDYFSCHKKFKKWTLSSQWTNMFLIHIYYKKNILCEQLVIIFLQWSEFQKGEGQ